ncbi:MAG: hypothetical protein SFU98_03345 [Leptospiraceae bacterium]|nr:hypothetical protein [Leptospiraceae bacterium]
MKKILRDNAIYIFFLIVFWVITIPYVYGKQDLLFEWFSNLVSPTGYNPRVMKSFVKKGDSAISKHFLDRDEKDEKKFFEELSPYMERMKEACEFYEEVGTKDAVLNEPTWLDRNTRWKKEGTAGEKLDSFKRNPLSESVTPYEFWKANIEEILTALDYYKRALNYSGPEIKPARRIHLIAGAACRPAEVILAYSSYISSSENYVEAQVRKEMGVKTSGLSEKQIQYAVWARIKSNKDLPELNDFLKGITYLLTDTNFKTISPYEADKLYERILSFLQNTNDPGQQKNEREFRLKRGKLLYELAKSDSKYYTKALKQFEAAKEFDNLSVYTSKEIRPIMSHIFESKLYIARCHLRMKDFKTALHILQDMEVSLRSVDGRENFKPETDLLQDYHVLLREAFTGLGRIEEADQIEL